MLALIKSITKSEWKFWAKVLVALLILTSLSRIFIVILAPQGYVPRGNTIVSFIDRYVYISYIEQAREGNFLFQDLFTSKEESVPMLNLFWLAAGLFARATGFSANIILELLRILFLPLLLLGVYLLIAYFIENIWQRKLAYLLASLSGGLGAYFLPVIYLMEKIRPLGKMQRDYPIDLDSSEATIFGTGYYSAHFIFSTVLFIFIMLFTLLAIDKKKILYALPAGILSFVLINFHPFTFLILFFIFLSYFIFLLWQNKEEARFIFKYGLLAGLVALPSVIYHFYMFGAPWWQNQTWNSTTYRPIFIAILAGYGAILFFALRSLWFAAKGKAEIKKEKFLLVWFLSQIALIFMPVSVQGRFFEGYWLLLVILASYSLTIFLQKRAWITKDKIYAAVSFVAIFGMSFLLLLVLDLKNVFLRGNLVYIKKDAVSAMKELRNIAGKDDLILADIYNASMLPGISLRRVFVGHGVETIDYDRKYKILQEFMAASGAEKRKEILRSNKINYLFYDEGWKKDWAWNPDDEKFLQEIYDEGGYKIYKVK